VLTYHDVTDDPTNPTDQVSPTMLRSQLAFLGTRGVRFVSLGELTDRVLAHEDVDGLVAVTFDDALVGVYRHGVDVLAGLGIPATVFVVSRRLGTESPAWYPGSDRTMTEQELRAVADAGIGLGSHTRTHPELPALEPRELADELAGSRADLESWSGAPVDLLAYPSGHFDAAVCAATRAAGYRAAFTFRPGRVSPGLDAFRLPRLPMGSTWSRSHLAYALGRPASSYPPHQLDEVR
jgi:peptidoglycan/xylan/chitin deacetylase (PgdA/CDA1 family)